VDKGFGLKTKELFIDPDRLFKMIEGFQFSISPMCWLRNA